VSLVNCHWSVAPVDCRLHLARQVSRDFSRQPARLLSRDNSREVCPYPARPIAHHLAQHFSVGPMMRNLEPLQCSRKRFTVARCMRG